MTSQALSPALEKKRAQKEERLHSHYETYINDVNARRTLAAASSDPSESVDAFLASFAHSRDQVLALSLSALFFAALFSL
jgi:hypothetical protein